MADNANASGWHAPFIDNRRYCCWTKPPARLDNVTERHVVEAIHSRLPGVTIIMIAHRISTVRKCDRLYMIDRGQLAAEGTYEELLESNELFAELARFT